MARLPIINNLRIVPRDADFLDRKTGAKGEIFYDQTNNTLRVYDAVITGGIPLVKSDLSNVTDSAFLAKATAAGVGGGSGSIEVSDTAPTTPDAGTIWFNTNTARLYVYTNDGDSNQWIQPVSGLETTVTSILDLGISDGTNGQVLTTDGSGSFSFQDAAGGGASNWSELTGTPTTIAGYGITDANFLPLAGGTITGSIDAPGVANHRLRFLYDALGDLPNAGTYHGAIAHVHTEGKMYFAHAGAWVELANASTSTAALTDIGTDIAGEDLLRVVDDPTGSQIEKKVSVDNLLALVTFSSLTGTPTTLSGYGITDAQEALVSGTNIKTINGQTVLGSGNLTVSAITGSVTFSGTTVDSDDSSAITFTPSVVMSSDLTVENDLTVQNNLIINGEFTSDGSGTPEIFSDNEIELNAGTRIVPTTGPLQMLRVTTTQRNALIAANGDLIYNTTDNIFQGYENGSWVNLI